MKYLDLYHINEYDSVLLEDDLILCKNFKEEIEKVISQFPNKIINFFTKPELYFTTHYTDRFDYNQCTYYPKGMAKIIADEMTKMYKPDLHRSWAALTNRILQNLRINHVIYRPCLVQHKDNFSILQGGVNLRRNTLWFKDYLDEVGCPNMEEAFSQRYYTQLTACLFSRCNSNSLTNVPQVDGQMTFVKDTQEVYMDVGNNRTKVTDIIFINTLSEANGLSNYLTNKLYYVNETNRLYHYNTTSQQLEEVKMTAEETVYDNTESGMEANTVQGAIDEVNTKVDEVNEKIGTLSTALDTLNGEVI